jgi:translation initiation factor 2 gamma subunit (eIF-2gamma)
MVGESSFQGWLRVGDVIEIRLGRISTTEAGFVYRRWRTRITSLPPEGNELEFAVPVGTMLGPAARRRAADRQT